MSLLDADIAWTRVGDCYAITKKPHGLNTKTVAEIPFAAMEAIPQGGAYEPTFTLKEARSINSGTYFERGDILVSKITPSFENGKQALVRALPQAFGYATTEVIPLRPSVEGQDPRLLFFYLLHPDIRHYVAERMEGSTGRQRVPEDVLLDLPVPVIAPQEQTAMADALETIQSAVASERTAESAAQELKRAAMRELFTRGLRGEAQKETEIGLVPESWDVLAVSESVTPFRFERSKQIPKSGYSATGRWPVVDQGQQIIAGYTDDEQKIITSKKPLIIFGDHTRAFKYVDFEFALGADGTKPLLAADGFHPKFLFFALSALDVPSRGYNRHYKVLAEKRVPKPSVDEQQEIVAILDAIDRKIDLHRQKRAVLEELFKALLHKLMTGEIRVDQLDLSALTPIEERTSP
ncbi:MAG: restriction endonuclease subunit S [Desulfovibrio sp.]|jgi:type I restriction enzyme S subunit|nr:restriction endonuclease subunit S [Desulfovibrio sp.]